MRNNYCANTALDGNDVCSNEFRRNCVVQF